MLSTSDSTQSKNQNKTPTGRKARVLAIECDVQREDQIKNAFEQTFQYFGSIDVVVNNTSAISLTDSQHTSAKLYDLMAGVNVRGTFMVSKLAFPYLRKSGCAHIICLSPPISTDSFWYEKHCAYTMSKYGMSMCVLGLSAEFRPAGIAVNALWPRTIIDTVAIRQVGKDTAMDSNEMVHHGRKVDIVVDAAVVMMAQDSKKFTGNFCIDEEVLRTLGGVTCFEQYAVVPGTKDSDLLIDYFLEEGRRGYQSKSSANAKSRL